MKTKINTLIVFMLFCVSAIAQNTLKGSVKDSDGIPVPGVNIIVKGTTNGTATDFDGNFSIKVENTATIVVSYLGYKTQEISVAGRSQIDITLENDNAQLNEVVVIGYGSIKKDEITSSIVSVDGGDIATTIASNPAEALQGKASGVQVLSSGGNPGASPQIVIRGITSNLGSAPLIVVDGIMMPSGTSLNFLNASDIDSFQVLKDASATAIYGSRASNGAVLVTTKRGKSGKSTVNVDVSHGYQFLKKIQSANSTEYVNVINQSRINDGNAPVLDINDYSADTDWWDETIENYAAVTNLNISASGGTEKIKSASSLSYFNQESNYTKGWYKRITGRLNLDYQISDKISLKQDVNPRIESWENTPSQLWNILRRDPITGVYLPQDEREGRNQFSIYTHGSNDVGNPVGDIKRQFNESKFVGFLSNTQLNYDITPELSVKTQFGFNFSNVRTDIFNPEYYQTVYHQRQINNISRRTTQRFDYVWNNTINFKKQIGEHSLNLLAGVLYDSQTENYNYGFRENVPDNDDPNLRYLDAAVGERVIVNGSEGVETIYSVIGRLVYNYNNKYFLTSSFRRDASSRFSKDNRVGLFPSISAAWDIDSEEFFKVSWVDNLKLKAGYGEVGNQNINREGQFFSIGSQDYVFGGQRVVTNYLSQFGNPNLKWETLTDFNIGLNGAILNNKIDFSIEYYEKTSKDLLFNVKLPNYTGIASLVAQNVGSFQSKGWDFQVGYNNSVKDFNYGVDLTISKNESIAKSLAVGNEQIFGQRREELGNRYLKITEEGDIVGAFYGLKTAGIFQNQTQINSHSTDNGVLLQPNAQPGDLIFVDNNNDGVINDSDLTKIGNPFPDFYGGINFNFSYKKLDFSMQWYGTFGNDVLNYSRTFLYAGTQDANVIKGAINKVWSPQNTSAEFPRLSVLDRNGNYKVPSDFFIEDGSYLRLRNIQLGYDFGIPGFVKSRVYIAGQNLLTITKYSGFDPEVQAGGDVINDFGVDYARYPTSSTVLLGLNLTL